MAFRALGLFSVILSDVVAFFDDECFRCQALSSF